MSSPRKLYSPEQAFDTGFLQVSPIHNIWYSQHGKRDGKPAVFLHGGPGQSSPPWAAQYFDPAVFRVVLFDQRGCGQSKPLGELKENTTQDIVSDIEKLRKHLGITKWHCVWGGSWGTTLALLYSQAHPEVVGSMVLRGVWAMTQEEFDVTIELMARIWPDVYETTYGYLTPEERKDIFASYYKRMTTGDQQSQFEAAKHYTYFPMMMSALIPPKDGLALLDHEEPDRFLAISRVNIWYCLNKGFIRDGQILEPENMRKIEHIPTWIVNGRYDMMCPVFMAQRVHKSLPNSTLYIVEGTGHTAGVCSPEKILESSLTTVQDAGNQDRLIEVTDDVGKLNV